MAKFKITPTTTVAELKEQFSNEVGGVLRIYEGRSEAADGATLVSLGAKEGELECRTSRTVGKFEEAFQNDLNLKVKVYTKDNWVKVLDGITLATAAELPNGMTKAKMEEYLSYQREEKEDGKADNEPIASGNDYVSNFFKGIPIIDITLDVVKETQDSENLVDYAYENFSAPAIGVVDYGDDWDSHAWVFVTSDPDEAMYPAFDFIEEKQNNGFRGELIHFQSTKCNTYGLDQDVFDIEGTLGCALNSALEDGKPTYIFEWDADVAKILFRVKYANGWISRIFFATSDGKTEDLQCLGDDGFEKILHNFEHPESLQNIPLESDDFSVYKELTLGKVKLGGKYGFINRKNQIVIPFEYDDARTFSQGYAKVKINGKFGLINEKGETIVPTEFDDVSQFCEEFCAVEVDDKWGFINRQNQLVIPAEYDYVRSFHEGYAAVKNNDKFGFVNQAGILVIPVQFDDASDFSEGLCAVEIDGKWVFIDANGNVVIEPQFIRGAEFQNGQCEVMTDEFDLTIDKKGNILKKEESKW